MQVAYAYAAEFGHAIVAKRERHLLANPEQLAPEENDVYEIDNGLRQASAGIKAWLERWATASLAKLATEVQRVQGE